MADITKATLNAINEDLTLALSKDVSSVLNQEQTHAIQYLSELIKPHIQEGSLSELTQDIAQTLRATLSRFFRIRDRLITKNSNEHIDAIFKILNNGGMLSVYQYSIHEDKVIGAMLSEIFTRSSVSAQKEIKGELELNNITKVPSFAGNYYKEAIDPTKSILNIYPHTGRNPLKPYANGQPLLFMAIQNRWNALLEKLVENSDGTLNTALEYIYDRDTPLRYAVKVTNAEAVKILLDAGADVTASSTVRGRTAWSMALESKHSDVIGFVFAARFKNQNKNDIIDLSTYKIDNQSLSKWVLDHRNKTVAELLLENKKMDFKPRHNLSDNILHIAAQLGWVNVVNQTLMQTSDNKALMGELLNRNENLHTPLHAAARAGNIEIMKKLIVAGADINAKDVLQWTVLFEAVYHQKRDSAAHEACVRHLLSCSNLDLSLIDLTPFGKTVLQVAVEYGTQNIVKILLEDNRVMVNLTEERCNDIEKIAREKKWADVTKLLEARRPALKIDSLEKIVAEQQNEIAALRRIQEEQSKKLDKQSNQLDELIALLKQHINNSSASSSASQNMVLVSSNASVLSITNTTSTANSKVHTDTPIKKNTTI